MGHRGRTSAAALGVRAIAAVSRPEPPDELTKEQATEWVEIVQRLRADWFTRENLPLLAQYCRTITRAREIAKIIDAYEADRKNFKQSEYIKLIGAEHNQTKMLTVLATKMRLTQRGTYDKQRRKAPKNNIKQPWAA